MAVWLDGSSWRSVLPWAAQYPLSCLWQLLKSSSSEQDRWLEGWDLHQEEDSRHWEGTWMMWQPSYRQLHAQPGSSSILTSWYNGLGWRLSPRNLGAFRSGKGWGTTGRCLQQEGKRYHCWKSNPSEVLEGSILQSRGWHFFGNPTGHGNPAGWETKSLRITWLGRERKKFYREWAGPGIVMIPNFTHKYTFYINKL